MDDDDMFYGIVMVLVVLVVHGLLAAWLRRDHEELAVRVELLEIRDQQAGRLA
jgi:hypothetical protein